jgi:glycosyltransferase involved in cell wall biosynthesis
MPDFLVFAAWYPKLTGAALILDIHDIVPELFESKFKSRYAVAYVRTLRWCERLCARFVDHVIVSNHLWHERLLSRSISPENSSVFLNHVDMNLFYRRTRTRSDDKVVIVFPGSFLRHQGLELAIEAIFHLKDKAPRTELHLYGGNAHCGRGLELAQLASQHGVSDRVKFFDNVRLEAIPQIIADADLGIVPKRADSFGNEAYSTKIMEFMSQGIPVVVSQTRIDTLYFDDSVVRFFPSGDSQALAEAIMDVIGNPFLRRRLAAAGLDYVQTHCWDTKKREYLELVDKLTTDRIADAARR